MASNERLRGFSAPLHAARNISSEMKNSARDRRDGHGLKGESIHFTDGEIGPALRASCAYPGLFLPVEYRGHVPGGWFSDRAVPAPAVRKMGAEVVISVHLEPGLLDVKPRNTIEVISRSFSIIQSVVESALARRHRRADRAGRSSRALG